MPGAGLILIADDESSFLRSTVELLCRDGYECDAARDADEALEMLQRKRYDLLIADIKMPGNADFRIVRGAQQFRPGMPVILVTGYPSVESAIEAVGLPVYAYLTKPVDYDLLLKHVEAAARSRPWYRMLTQVLQDLRECTAELEAVLSEVPLQAKNTPNAGLGVPALTIRRLTSCAGELLRSHGSHGRRGGTSHLCQAVDCPQWPENQTVFRDVIEVLQAVKRRFKSKELADLRQRVERHLEILEK